MSGRDPFDDGALVDVWGGRAPADLDREGRIALLAEVFDALMDGRMPSRRAALFVGGGGMQWLRDGGSLERTYWRVSAPAGSHHTPAYVWQRISSSRGAQEFSEGDSIEAVDKPDSRIKDERYG